MAPRPWVTIVIVAAVAGSLGWWIGRRTAPVPAAREVAALERSSPPAAAPVPLRRPPPAVTPPAGSPAIAPVPPSAPPVGRRDVVALPGELPAATEARRLFATGRHEDGYRLLEERAAAAPDERDRLLLLEAQILHTTGEVERAGEALDRIAGNDPSIAAQVRYLRQALAR